MAARPTPSAHSRGENVLSAAMCNQRINIINIAMNDYKPCSPRMN